MSAVSGANEKEIFPLKIFSIFPMKNKFLPRRCKNQQIPTEVTEIWTKEIGNKNRQHSTLSMAMLWIIVRGRLFLLDKVDHMGVPELPQFPSF